jgi:peptide/nickel transport system ATP-binding protein
MNATDQKAINLEAIDQEDAVIVAENLGTWFELRQWGIFRTGWIRAVDEVSFTLMRGQSVAFVGESGCGKSSLARTLLGLHRPTHGQIRIEGRNLATLDKKGLKACRARLGYVQQDPFGALPPFMSVRQILHEPLIIHRFGDRAAREQRIQAVLEEVRLTPPQDYLAKFPHQLSGGQQQRAVIARALLLEPVMIIADEPVSMLDASVRVEILNLLHRIRANRQLTLAFITHDLSTVRHYADRILVMYAGRIVEQAAVNDLLDHPQHPYTQALLGAIAEVNPDNARHLRDVPAGEPPSLILPPSGCHFHPRCPQAIAGKCDQLTPPTLETRPGQRVACWLYHPQ